MNNSSPFSSRATALCLGLSLMLLLAPRAESQQKMRLARIEFSGLQNHTEAEAITASGLQVGQVVDVPALDAAAQRLMDSGLFKKLGYRYRANGNQATVTFQVEEDKGEALPVVFDNFVWFTDEELARAVREHVPAFAGTASDTAIDGITKALQQLLLTKKIEARVEYAPSGTLTGKETKHLFSVEGVSIPICTLEFPGAAGVTSELLLKKSASLLEGDYKRSFASAFAQENLIPVYRERGFLRARFEEPVAAIQVETAGKCKGGVTVDLPVVEGPVYSWEKAEWTGNKAVSSEQLNGALSLKNGELANGLKIDKGISNARELFLKQGYLSLKIQPEPLFDDATKRVTYNLSVQEGPQYRMGTLTIIGFSETDIKRLHDSWKLKAGDIYDGTYLRAFLRQEVGPVVRASGSKPKNIETGERVNRDKLTVDVVLNFKM